MWNESSCSLETTATLYFFTGCEEWKQSSQLWKEGTSYQEESQCSCDSKRLAAQTGMDVITCFCSDTSMQSSRKSQCFPRNWKGRSLGVGDTGQCWVLPQTSIMRNSFLARTPRFMHGFELEEETGKWASPSQLNVGAITLLLKSGFLSCWLVVRVIFDSLRTQSAWGWLWRSYSMCLVMPFYPDQRLILVPIPFCSPEAGGRRLWEMGTHSPHIAVTKTSSQPARDWIIEFRPVNRILQLLELLRWQKHIFWV